MDLADRRARMEDALVNPDRDRAMELYDQDLQFAQAEAKNEERERLREILRHHKIPAPDRIDRPIGCVDAVYWSDIEKALNDPEVTDG